MQTALPKRSVILALALIDPCFDEVTEDDVVSHARAGADFARYRSFSVTGAEALPLDVTAPRIPAEAKLELAAASDHARVELVDRGLFEATRGARADLLIFSLSSTDAEAAYGWSCVPGKWWGYMGWVWDLCTWLEPIYPEFRAGTVAVGLVDLRRGGVVFGGLLRRAGDGAADAERRIRSGVHEMFKNYPVPSAP